MKYDSHVCGIVPLQSHGGEAPRQSHGIAIVKYFFYPHVDITLIYFVLTGNLDYYFRLTAHLVLPRVSPAGKVAG